MNPILEAINKGYSSDEILQFISKAIPKLVPQINKAVSQGYGIKQILGFLSKTSPQDTRGLSQPQIQRRNRESDIQIAQHGLMALGTGLAANATTSALSRALPRSLAPISQSPAIAVSTAGNAMPANGMNMPHQQQIAAQTTTLNNPTASQQPPSNLGNANIAQPANIQQPKEISNPKDYLEKKGVLQAVNESLKRGNNPLQVATELGIKKTGHAKIDQELLKNIEEYAAQPKEEIAEEKITEPIKIEKKSIVNSPQGVGELKELRNGKGLIEIEGKTHQVNEEDLEASPLPEKDLAELYDDLISGIEHETGEDVSRMVQWAGYNPETNTLQFLPHSGKLYKYGNISQEDAALLTDILSTRKTSGSNFIGAWKAGSKSPIGAALSKLIRKLQSERGGKGQEYEETHESIYSAYEPAIEAKKEKMRKKKKK